ncbi:MAG: radical SAM protein [Myxococcota bacterium]
MTADHSPQIWPSYLRLLEDGTLEERVKRSREMLGACRVCPRGCDVNRREDERGECKTGRSAEVSSAQLHFGEEPPLVGRGGSGTIFFARCNLACTYCQNHDISHGGEGRPVSAEALARAMLALQKAGAENVNFVSPSHVVPQLLEAVLSAAQAGLRVPLVYNTGGYDAVPTLRLLEGVVDIYMPDAKYADADVGLRYSGVASYPSVNRSAILEMHRQVGDLELDDAGVARRGLIVRHLVLPGDLAGTRSVMRFLAERVSRDTYVNVMAQYRPCFQACRDNMLGRPLRWTEYQHAVEVARQEGLHRLAR